LKAKNRKEPHNIRTMENFDEKREYRTYLVAFMSFRDEQAYEAALLVQLRPELARTSNRFFRFLCTFIKVLPDLRNFVFSSNVFFTSSDAQQGLSPRWLTRTSQKTSKPYHSRESRVRSVWPSLLQYTPKDPCRSSGFVPRLYHRTGTGSNHCIFATCSHQSRTVASSVVVVHTISLYIP
jgi:hypothetical protein